MSAGRAAYLPNCLVMCPKMSEPRATVETAI